MLTEVDRLLGQPFDESPQGRRDQAILETLYSTGCRVAECAAMRLLDLDLDEGIVRVLGKGQKQRLCLLGAPARRAIAAWLPERRSASDPPPTSSSSSVGSSRSRPPMSSCAPSRAWSRPTRPGRRCWAEPGRSA